MKKFDIEKAKEGHPLCTRGGKKARIISYDCNGSKPIVALIEREDGGGEESKLFYQNGRLFAKYDTKYDLMLSEESDEFRDFNLQEAMDGHPVCTRRGNPVRLICFDHMSQSGDYPIIGLVQGIRYDGSAFETIHTYTKDGREKSFLEGNEKSDLVMDCVRETIKCTFDANGFEYVDLGLPSGLLWAKCNVGATSEEEAGLYFAWGEVNGATKESVKLKERKFLYTWDTYKFVAHWGDGRKIIENRLGQPIQFTKYNDKDKKTVLGPEDDAAHVQMGGDWRMPTNIEFNELLSNTKLTIVFVDGQEGSISYEPSDDVAVIHMDIHLKDWVGIKYLKCQSLKDKDKYIIFPANGSVKENEVVQEEYSINVWTSTVYSDIYTEARELAVMPFLGYLETAKRYFGCAVRGVIEPNK